MPCRPTLHEILLSALSDSYRHLANKFTHRSTLHVDVIEYTVCGPDISVGVEIPPLLHICLSFDDGLHITTRIIYCLLVIVRVIEHTEIATPKFTHIQPNRIL